MRHGSIINPANRFDRQHHEPDYEHLAWDENPDDAVAGRRVEYLDDRSASIVSENDSPDVPFRYSLNPYRGCMHGCAYCYARNTHEYLGLGAGLDFETKIFVKRGAAELLRQFLARDGWQAEPITFSGVTDCYQPAEHRWRLTRQCLEVALECGQPVAIITKNALVERDLDVLSQMAARRLVHVLISITTLDAELARVMEPLTSVPSARLRAVSSLVAAGIPTGVMVAPIIPGLNDSDMANVMKAAAQSGARFAGYTLVRLPLAVAPVFLEWLNRTQPLRATKVEARIRQIHGGKLTTSQWGRRMRGTGPLADEIRALFRLLARKLGLDHPLPPLASDQFMPPAAQSGQRSLF